MSLNQHFIFLHMTVYNFVVKLNETIDCVQKSDRLRSKIMRRSLFVTKFNGCHIMPRYYNRFGNTAWELATAQIEAADGKSA